MSEKSTFCAKPRTNAKTSKQARTGRGIHGLPKVSPRPAMPNPSTSCGRATTQTALRPFGGSPARRAGGCLLPPRIPLPVRAWPPLARLARPEPTYRDALDCGFIKGRQTLSSLFQNPFSRRLAVDSKVRRTSGTEPRPPLLSDLGGGHPSAGLSARGGHPRVTQ